MLEKFDTGETRVSGISDTRTMPIGSPTPKLNEADEYGDIIGQVLDERFKIVEKLGRGGMSAVFKADHLLLERPVAVKLLHRNMSSNVSSVQRFHREAKAISSLDHENIVKVHAFGLTAAGHCYLVMDLVAAQSLAEMIAECGALPVERALQLFQGICKGLIHTHGRGITHRDLKPANVMVCRDDAIKIVDFGIAHIEKQAGNDKKLTEAGSTCGSPPYMSPEQCLGDPIDHRADIYALGVLFFECLAGRRPFVGASSGEVMLKHLNDDPPRFSEVAPQIIIPPSLEAIIRKCLAKKPEDRYQSVQDLSSDLAEVGSGSDREDTLSKVLAPPAVHKNKCAIPKWLLVTFASCVALFPLVFFSLPQGKVLLIENEVSQLFANRAPDFAALESKVFDLADQYIASGSKIDAQRVLKKLALFADHDQNLNSQPDRYCRLIQSIAVRLEKLGAEHSHVVMEKAIARLTADADAFQEEGNLKKEADSLIACTQLLPKVGKRASDPTPRLFTISVKLKNQNNLNAAHIVDEKILALICNEPNPTAGEQRMEFHALGQLAELYLCDHSPDLALSYFKRAADMARKLGGEASPAYIETVKRIKECEQLLNLGKRR